ncbi:MAG: hypothetical protein R2770_18430 [Acidimicrobiales bacterium]|nr:hypothetical protein [Acidimicrobiales bacterium]
MTGLKLSISLLGMVLLAGACSASDVAEEVIENRIEAETGGDVEFDIDDDAQVRVSTDDGDLEISSTGDRPGGWPEYLSEPAGSTILTSVSFVDETSNNMSMTIEASAGVEELAEHYHSALADWDMSVDSRLASGEELSITRQYEKGGAVLTLFVYPSEGGSGAQITYTEEVDDQAADSGAGDAADSGTASFDSAENAARTLGLDDEQAAELGDAIGMLSPETRYQIVFDQLSLDGEIKADGNQISLILDLPEAEGDFLMCVYAGAVAAEGEQLRIVYSDAVVEC